MTSAPEQQFDRVAAAYATSPIHALGPDLDWMAEALAPDPGAVVLDLGTGAGHAALRVARQVARVTAVDLSEAMLATARRLAVERGIDNLTTIRADVAALPFPDGTFDGAISRYSSHHWHDPAAALAEAARTVRPGGRFVLIDTVAPADPALDTFVNALELLRDASHGRDVPVSGWRAAFQAAGFRVDALREWPIEQATEPWLARAATPAWRAAACRRLLLDASAEARTALDIAPDASRWSVPAAMLTTTRLP